MIFRKQREILRLERAMADARETIRQQAATINAVTADRDQLRSALSWRALSGLLSLGKIVFESTIDREGADMAIFAARERGDMILSGVINEALTVEIVQYGSMVWLIIVDDLRVIMGAPASALEAVTKIGELMVEEVYERAQEMEGGDEEIVYRALGQASQEAEIKVWAQTAIDVGDLEGEIG